MRAGGSAPGSHRPRLAPAPRSPPRVPVVACAGHATRMAGLTVRVSPRSRHPGVEVGDRGVVVRVRAAPEGGRATEEARRVLAAALGLAPSAVTLRRGATSREKVFDVVGLTGAEALQRLRS